MTSKTTPEAEFLERLETFRQEADQCAQFLYTYLSIHTLAGDDSEIRHGLDRDALFWNTVLGALQTAIFIALDRVFDAKGKHGVAALCAFAKQHEQIFSRRALAQRKGASYAAGAQEPESSDFQGMALIVRSLVDIYNCKYLPIRNKVFAHRVFSKHEPVAQLFSKTDIGELERMTTLLGQFQRMWFDAYHNGNCLKLGSARHSVREMLNKPSGSTLLKPVQEAVTASTKSVMKSIALKPRRGSP